MYYAHILSELTIMTLQVLYLVLLLLHLHSDMLASATTSIVLYTDDACQDIYVIVQTDTRAGDGHCGEANGTNSASPIMIDLGCSGIECLLSASHGND